MDEVKTVRYILCSYIIRRNSFWFKMGKQFISAEKMGQWDKEKLKEKWEHSKKAEYLLSFNEMNCVWDSNIYGFPRMSRLIFTPCRNKPWNHLGVIQKLKQWTSEEKGGRGKEKEEERRNRRKRGGRETRRGGGNKKWKETKRRQKRRRKRRWRIRRRKRRKEAEVVEDEEGGG